MNTSNLTEDQKQLIEIQDQMGCKECIYANSKNLNTGRAACNYNKITRYKLRIESGKCAVKQLKE